MRTGTNSREGELEEYIQEARHFVRQNTDPSTLLVQSSPEFDLLSIPDKLFVDLAYTYPDRLAKLKSFWSMDVEAAYTVLRTGLSETFDIIYTKIWQGDDQNRTSSSSDAFSFLLWIFTQILPIVPIGLFHSSHKEAYKGSDIVVTVILLYVTYLLEFSSWQIWAYFGYEWPDVVAQHSIIGSLARNKRHTRVMGILQCLGCKGLADQYFPPKPYCYSSKNITMLVRAHVEEGWMHYIKDIESYWMFNDIRGHWTLELNNIGWDETLIRASIEKPFDESIIIWHREALRREHHYLALSHRFFSKATSTDPEHASLCREMSNYMMHLLFANPEMLMPGSRRILFTTTYNELQAILGDADVSLWDETRITQKILDKAGPQDGFVHDARVLAQGLMRLGDEKAWQVIRGIWTEVLCFSAVRCRGFFHAKSLESGGEYLSFVSLLMSHAGLETFAERHQRLHLWLPRTERVRIAEQNIQEAARSQATGGSSSPQDMVHVNGEDSASATIPSASQDNKSLKEEEVTAIEIAAA
ncbi:LOW QUALITY PROTEIN: hypothetical protein U9M48_002380 [Paspalum notatum var. saurae]|uniref:DUF4220 domain-containing protein n=1 Tax=Paspalum notatum var. saurae TaxID=547442 RepID=A0AAQ3SDG3_PASNO